MAQPPLPAIPRGHRAWIVKLPFRCGSELAQGAIYHKPFKAHVFIGDALPARLVPYASKPYTYLRWIEDDLNKARGPQPANVVEKTPRPDQVKDSTTIATAAHRGYRGFLLSSDVGTGKTYTALLAAKVIARMRGVNTILITVDRPATITVASWRDAIASLGDDGLRWVVVSSDSLGHLIARNGKPKHSFGIVINDEAQLFRNPTNRTSYMRRINRLSSPPESAPFVISITATPGHTPAEWGYLSSLYAQIHGDPPKDWEDFGAALCERGVPLSKSFGRWSWDEEAKASIRRQSEAIGFVRDKLLRHRPPLMIARPAPWGDPPFDFALIDLSPEQQQAYELEWGEFRRTMKLAKSGNDVAKGLAAITRLLQKAAMIRVDNTVEAAIADIERGYQVLIATQFVSTASDPIANKLESAGYPVARIYGSRPDVEDQRLMFQRGEAKVVVFNTTSSINLQAGEELADGSVATTHPRRGYFHQPRYSGIAAEQTMGRAHRNSQVCRWSLLAGAGTLEERAAATMFSRLLACTTSTNGDVSAWSEMAALFNADWIPQTSLEEAMSK